MAATRRFSQHKLGVTLEGFIYVLINPAMPGLAKVGKTRRRPEDRGLELSSATGVPSPFIVAYQLPVADIDAAEKWVHGELERTGHRHSASREFFRAPLHVVVEVVSRAGLIRSVGLNSDDARSDTATDALAGEELAERLFELGEAARSGTDSTLPDAAEALKYYEQSAAMGHPTSCTAAALLYEHGAQGSSVDLQKALTYHRRAVDLGQWVELASIANIFFKVGQPDRERDNWILFFQTAASELSKPDISASYAEVIVEVATTYFALVAVGLTSDCVPRAVLAPLASACADCISSKLDSARLSKDNDEYGYLDKAFEMALTVADALKQKPDGSLPFEMTVTRAVCIDDIGSLVSGTIECGHVTEGTVVTVPLAAGAKRGTVEGIQWEGKMIDKAETGMVVDLMFRTTDFSAAVPGCLVAEFDSDR